MATEVNSQPPQPPRSYILKRVDTSRYADGKRKWVERSGAFYFNTLQWAKEHAATFPALGIKVVSVSRYPFGAARRAVSR